MKEIDRGGLRHVTYRSTTTPSHLQKHFRRNACGPIYLFTVSDDKKAGHWTGLFGHDRRRDGKRRMGEFKIDTQECMNGRDCTLVLAELIAALA